MYEGPFWEWRRERNYKIDLKITRDVYFKDFRSLAGFLIQ